LRQIDALSLLSAGKSVKETAIELGYTDPAHLSRDFKQFYGRPPTWVQRITALGGLV
jgi:AraC-like DNA-binding protein